MIRTGLVSVWLVLLLSAVGAIFWYTDWVYQLPTPIPANYKPVALGSRIDVSKSLGIQNDKPIFLHFYNPECPCSRFNKRHFQSLVKANQDKVNFAVLVLSDKSYTAAEIQEKLGANIPVIFDQSFAARCGVYSTPQAALFDTDQKLFYRGNYNASRYCTEEKTAYAKLALADLLEKQPLPIYTAEALTSYGCTLPVCKN